MVAAITQNAVYSARVNYASIHHHEDGYHFKNASKNGNKPIVHQKNAPLQKRCPWRHPIPKYKHCHLYVSSITQKLARIITIRETENSIIKDQYIIPLASFI